MLRKTVFTLAVVCMVAIIAAPSFAQRPKPKRTRILRDTTFRLDDFNLSQAQRPKPRGTEIRGHTMYTLMEPGGIPAIFEPEFVSIEVADSFYYDEEPLIAVSSGNVARGYSTWHLDHHEIVNDVLEGTAIAVTW